MSRPTESPLETPPPLVPPPSAPAPFSPEEFQLNWTQRDLEQRLGFRGGRFANVNRWLSFLLGLAATLAFYVYPDSFAAFRQVRDYAAAAGWEFGIDLPRAGDDLIWGSRETTPPPL